MGSRFRSASRSRRSPPAVQANGFLRATLGSRASRRGGSFSGNFPKREVDERIVQAAPLHSSLLTTVVDNSGGLKTALRGLLDHAAYILLGKDLDRRPEGALAAG